MSSSTATLIKHQMYIDAEDYRSLENDVRNALGSDGLTASMTRKIAARTDLTDANKRNFLGENARRYYPALAGIAAR